jgi:hypothetical protein
VRLPSRTQQGPARSYSGEGGSFRVRFFHRAASERDRERRERRDQQRRSQSIVSSSVDAAVGMRC